jgi:hypothetical protein
MDQRLSETDVAGALIDILAAAVDEYRAALDDISRAIALGRPATPEQLERAMAATLRLENAQTLFDLDADRQRDVHKAQPRRIH